MSGFLERIPGHRDPILIFWILVFALQASNDSERASKSNSLQDYKGLRCTTKLYQALLLYTLSKKGQYQPVVFKVDVSVEVF
jgi:hypothetical protein